MITRWEVYFLHDSVYYMAALSVTTLSSVLGLLWLPPFWDSIPQCSSLHIGTSVMTWRTGKPTEFFLVLRCFHNLEFYLLTVIVLWMDHSVIWLPLLISFFVLSVCIVSCTSTMEIFSIWHLLIIYKNDSVIKLFRNEKTFLCE